jgi:poly(A) polymerase
MKATFKGHDVESAKMAENILKRLKLPNEVIKNTVEPIAQHMNIFQLPKMSKPHKVRKILGLETFDILELLNRSDCEASVREDGSTDTDLKDFIEEAKSKFGVELPKPIVQGNDLISLGHKPGIAFKFVLDKLFEKQLNGNEDKESLLKQVEGLFKQSLT